MHNADFIPPRLRNGKIRFLWDMTVDEAYALLHNHDLCDPNIERLKDPRSNRVIETEMEFHARSEPVRRFAYLRSIVLRDMFGAYLFLNPDLPGDALLAPSNRRKTPHPGVPPMAPFAHYSEDTSVRVAREIWHEFYDAPLNGKKIFANITQKHTLKFHFVERIAKIIATNPDAVSPEAIASIKPLQRDLRHYKDEMRQFAVRLSAPAGRDRAIEDAPAFLAKMIASATLNAHETTLAQELLRSLTHRPAPAAKGPVSPGGPQ